MVYKTYISFFTLLYACEGRSPMATFPDINSKDFYDRINSKKEFRIHELPAAEGKGASAACSIAKRQERFQFMHHQLFISNFLSPETHYTRMLLYHLTGTGKTNSLLGVAIKYNELYREMYAQGLWNKNFIYILAPEEAIQNFRNELRKIYNLHDLDERNFKQTIQKPKNGGFFKLMGYQDFVNRTLREHQLVPTEPEEQVKIIKESNFYKKTPIYNLDNCVLMIDECHKILENNYGEHIQRILNKSVGTRFVMASGTPMMHTPDEAYYLIELLNPGKLRYNEVFMSPHKLTPDGLNLIKEAIRGYVSYLRGGSPETFPERIELGELLPGAKFTKVIRCPMMPGSIQEKIYNENFSGDAEPEDARDAERDVRDVIDIEKQAILNFVLPNGMYSKKDLSENIRNLEPTDLRKMGASFTVDTRTNDAIVTGSVLSLENLKPLSAKYYKLIKHLKHSNKLTVVYHRYVNGSGVKMIGQMLAQNGFTQYSPGNQHDPTKPSNNYVLIHGEIPPVERHKIVKTLKSPENKHGQLIRIAVCSEIMSQSVDLKNIREMHILHYQDNFSTLEQIIGRAIRNCSMADLPHNEWKVEIYKYCLTRASGTKPTAEEQRYVEKEADFVEIRKICHVFKEVAVDGLLNYKANVFSTDKDYSRECDFQRCKFKLDGVQKPLPSIRDSSRDSYIFGFYKYEVEQIKHATTQLFTKKPMATIKEIINYVTEQPDLTYIDNEYIFVAITEMIDTKQLLKDIYGREGHLKMIGQIYTIKPLIEHTHNYNEIEISNLLHAFRQLKGGPSKISWEELISNISSKHSIQLAQYLSRVELDKQRQLLELAISQLHSKGPNENINKVLNNYKRYLFYESDSGYSSLGSLDDITEFTPIGHFLTDPPRKLLGHSGTALGWGPAEKQPIPHDDRKENDIIIGFIEKDKNNEMVFKLRDPEEQNRYIDRRHERRGYVCTQKNDKKVIIELFKKLEVPINPNDPLENICSRLELELRKRESKKYKNKKWFYDYFERS